MAADRLLTWSDADVGLASFAAGSGRRSTVRLYFEPHPHAPWLPRAYALAVETMRAIRARRVVDLGCRDGVQLMDAFQESGADTVGADFRHHIRAANQRFPDRRWVGIHPTDYADLESLLTVVEEEGPTLILALDVLEHVDDPRPILRTLGEVLRRDPNNRAVIGITPRGGFDSDQGAVVPADTTHFREWSAAEAEALATSAGLLVERRAHIAEGIEAANYPATVLTVRFDAAAFEAMLARAGLPASGLETLILTTESYPSHPRARLGSYAEARARVDPSERVAVCSFADLKDAGTVGRADPGWILAGPRGRGEQRQRPEDMALAMVEQLVYLYPSVRLVESPDTGGIGLRVNQARRAGLLPPAVQTRVRCHGTKVYDELVSRTWVGMADAETAYRERMTLEIADSVSLNSEFLRRLYEENGYTIETDRARVEPYQFGSTDIDSNLEYQAVERVVVLGDAPWWPGTSDLAPTLRQRLAEQGAPSVSLSVQHIAEPTREVGEMLRAEAGRVACVVATYSPRAPFLLMAVVQAGCPVVAVDVGPLVELVPKPCQADVICAPDLDSVVHAIRELIGQPPAQRRARSDQLRRAMATEHGAPAPTNLLPTAVDRPPHPVDRERPTSTVVVPIRRANLARLADLLEGLNQQSVRPDEVLVVDDGSGPVYADDLEQLIASRLTIPHRIIRQPHPSGAGAARNVGLAEACSDIVIFLDPDDIPKNDFVKQYGDVFCDNPGVRAVNSYAAQFADGDDWADAARSSIVRSAVGASPVLGQIQLCFGGASAAFDTAALRTAGGWPRSDPQTAEDYELWLKLGALNWRLDVIPRATYLDRQPSDPHPARGDQLRLVRLVARSMPAYDLFDRLRLFALLRASKLQAVRLKRLEGEAGRHRREARRLSAEVERLERLNRSDTSRIAKLEARLQKLESLSTSLRQQLERPEHRLVSRLRQRLERLAWRR